MNIPILRSAIARLLVLGICSGPTIVIAGAADERPPNVILLLIDDTGYGDVAVHGNPIVKTPSFDRLHD